jgi:hypothetical protein
MLLTETLHEDEYILKFGKDKLDERLGWVCPQHEHYIESISVRVSPRTERRTAVANCVCGAQARPSVISDRMTYAQMLALAMLDEACPGTVRRAPCETSVPDDCSSITE